MSIGEGISYAALWLALAFWFTGGLSAFECQNKPGVAVERGAK